MSTPSPRAAVSLIGDAVVAAPAVGGPGNFGVQISLESQGPVVSVRGDLDLLTAPTLAGLMTALGGGGPQSFVLDLGGLTFMSAAGLGVIASASSRLSASGVVLRIRSAPEQTLRLLEIAGLTSSVLIEMSHSNVHLKSDLVRAASLPARNEAIDTELHIVVSVASATLKGADGVSVTLERQGRLTTVVASNDTVLRMDSHQYDTGEGPCLSAASEGREFHIESLAEESRWPAFVPLALDEGIASILSRPLITADRPVGALNIYSNTAGAFGSEHQELAAMIAEQASRIVADNSADLIDEQMGARISEALRSRLVLAQAQGVLMTRSRVSAEEATATLHRSARAAGTSVLGHAAQIVASTGVDVGPLERLGNG